MVKVTVVWMEFPPAEDEEQRVLSAEYENVMFDSGVLYLDGDEFLDTNMDEWGGFDDIEFLEIDGIVLIGNRAEWQGGGDSR